MTLGYWARAWPLNTEQGKAADPYLSPFDFSFIIRSIQFSGSLAFHPLLTPHLSLSQPLSLSLYHLSLGNSAFSLCAEQMSSPELPTDDGSQWEL